MNETSRLIPRKGDKSNQNDYLRHEKAYLILLYPFFGALAVLPMYASNNNTCMQYTENFKYYLNWFGVATYISCYLKTILWHLWVSYRKEKRHFYFEIIEETVLYLSLGSIIMLINYWVYSTLSVYWLIVFIFYAVLITYYSASYWSRLFYVSELSNHSNDYIWSIVSSPAKYGFFLFLDFLFIVSATGLCISTVYYFMEVTNNGLRPCNCPGSTNVCP